MFQLRQTLTILLTGLVLLAAAFARAQTTPEIKTETLTQLRTSRGRPTITEFKQALTPWPARNPFTATPNRTSHSFTEILADVIARLEQVYPGATYVGMGRDMVPLVDMLDAFYQSIGQPRRALRINGSGYTMRTLDTNLLVKFLQGSGFDFNNILTQPTFVLFDSTNYHSVSQMAYLMRAAYGEAARLNIDRKIMLNHFNGIKVSFATETKEFNSTEYRKNQESNFLEISGVTYPAMIEDLFIQDNKIVTYAEEWHPPFGTLIAMPDGTAKANPGAWVDESQHEKILFDMYEWVTRTSTPEFRALVAAKAKKRGIVINGLEVNSLEAKPTQAAQRENLPVQNCRAHLSR